MTTVQIKATQKRIGVDPDGFWGPVSIAACQDYLRAMMPRPNPWPASDEASLLAFYGRAGDESNLVTIEFPIPMRYAGKPVSKTRVHKRCAASLLDILSELGERFKHHPEILSHVQDYGGCYNHRPMRGGTRPSLHARGAAIDLSAGTNGNLAAWPVASTMPIEVMEVFARHGWLSAGAFWGRDAMHFQATR